MLGTLLLAFAALERPNVLLILADDLGVDLVGVYGEGPAPPCTPTLDEMAAQGILFRNAWTNPICSPTRAQVLTGRHAFRTGVGYLVPRSGAQSGLPLAETTIPEVLGPHYSTAVLGKWHLGHPYDDGPMHPIASGFGQHRGSLYNLTHNALAGGVNLLCPGPHGYDDWIKATDGVETCSKSYATTDTADETIASMRSLAEPWFLLSSFAAVHAPLHVPAGELCPVVGVGCYCDSIGPDPTIFQQKKAMVEAFDLEVRRVLTQVPRGTYVFLMGDNGSGGATSEGPPGGCFGPDHAKGTMYQGGVRVPFLAVGPGVPRGVEVDALVSSTDLFATVAALARVPAAAEDSVSLVPYLRGSTEPLRETVYAERFAPNGDVELATNHRQAVRDERWKLIRRREGEVVTEELYDLELDPCETDDLCAGGDCSDLRGEAAGAYVLLAGMLP